MSILNFSDAVTEALWHGENTKAVAKVCPPAVRRRAEKKLDALHAAVELRDLRSPPGNQLELLKGSRAGQYSIRVNDQYRICFTWKDGAGAADVEFTDYHDE